MDYELMWDWGNDNLFEGIAYIEERIENGELGRNMPAASSSILRIWSRRVSSMTPRTPGSASRLWSISTRTGPSTSWARTTNRHILKENRSFDAKGPSIELRALFSAV
jgi:hypothetical protein